MRLIIIDDKTCKKELNGFLTENSASVTVNVALDDVENKVADFLDNINRISATDKKIAINTSDSLFLVNIKNIVRCESKRNYTLIHFKKRKELLVAKTLREFEEILEPFQFFRVHRSHLINMQYVEKYMKGKGSILLNNGTLIKMSQRKRESFFKLINKL